MVDNSFSQNIEWQIPRRKQIQDMMLRQLKLLQNPSFNAEDNDHFYPIMRIVQATFSLWRSLFLTMTDKNHKRMCSDAEKMLETLLESNSYTFQSDLRDRTFTAAYYNTNARYRIERLSEHDASFQQLSSVKNVLKVKTDDLDIERNEMELWDLCFKALNDCFTALETRFLQTASHTPQC